MTNVRYLVFTFSVYLRQGPICNYYFYRLVPDLATLVTFCSLVQIQRNQYPLHRYEPLYPVKQLKHVFEILKFELDQILIQTSFDRNLSFITPI